MVNYVPILKARQGELTALSNLASLATSMMTPILEIPSSSEGPIKDAYGFIKGIRDHAPAGLRVGVDVSYLANIPEGARCPMRDIGEDLANWGIPVIPTVHLCDSDDRLASHGAVAQMHKCGAVVRLGGITTRDPAVDEASRELPRIWRQTGLELQQCDLLVDMAEVRSERDVGRAVPIARAVVEWALAHQWRSITVASGAMPESLSGMPTNTATSVPRWDAALWQRLADLGVGYADYGIAHPAMPTGIARSPSPSLRYTAEGQWWVYRWKTYETGGNDAFYDLCEALVSSDHWPPGGPDFSWGDSQLARCARRIPGPGNATSWRAWGTSHHLAYIIARLANSDEP